MINYLSKFNYLSIKLITCQNKLIADQKMIDYICPFCHIIATYMHATSFQFSILTTPIIRPG